MGVTGVSGTSNSMMPMKQKIGDNYEKDIQQQITRLQEKIKSLDSDKDISKEQKINEKQELQEKIQDLNNELRQHQMEEKQEESEQKKEELKRAEENQNVIDTENKTAAGLGKSESGVMITLSSTNKQMESMRKIRTDLEGKMRTAPTEKEKASLQEKIGNLSKGIGKTIKKSTDTISDYHKSDKDETGRAKAAKSKDQEENKGTVILPNGNRSSFGRSAEDGEVKVILPSKSVQKSGSNSFFIN